MRKILFRGKRKDNGEWVYGDLLGGKYIVIDVEQLGETIAFTHYEVIPETVGQYTGLKDKNGKEIFEDDILSYIGEGGKIIIGQVWWNQDGLNYIDVTNKQFIPCQYHLEKSAEIIGNIHDNPELLK